jgi:hypothetical protein
VVGGVVPSGDYDFLQGAGVAAIYPPGTNIPETAREILKLLRARPASGRRERLTSVPSPAAAPGLPEPAYLPSSPFSSF